MGVYCDVHMCVKGDAPLSVDQRARIVQICIEEEVLHEEAAFAVPEKIAPRTFLEWVALRVPLFQTRLPSFERACLTSYKGVQSERAVHVVRSGSIGAWLVDLAREHPCFAVGCTIPKWGGETVDGGFVYLATDRRTLVRTFNAYADPKARKNPFVEADGRVGEFFDILGISSKRNLDGKIASRSKLAKRVRKEVGVSLVCRASWW